MFTPIMIRYTYIRASISVAKASEIVATLTLFTKYRFYGRTVALARSIAYAIQDYQSAKAYQETIQFSDILQS